MCTLFALTQVDLKLAEEKSKESVLDSQIFFKNPDEHHSIKYFVYE